MSHSDFVTTLRSTNHDFIAALRFLDDCARHRALSYSHGNFSPSDEEMQRHFVPRFDLEEHEDRYEIYGELPGVRKENMNVEANDDRNIVIKGWLTRMASRPAEREELYLSGEGGDDIESKAGDGKDFVEVKHTDTKSVPNSRHDAGSSKSAPTQAHTRPETARFGDALDPHAEFVKAKTEQGDTAGESHKPTESKPKVLRIISERQYGQFHRAFHFPSPIKKEEVTARMENGILHVTAPRAPVPPPRKVEVDRAVPLDYPLVF